MLVYILVLEIGAWRRAGLSAKQSNRTGSGVALPVSADGRLRGKKTFWLESQESKRYTGASEFCDKEEAQGGWDRKAEEEM